MTARKSTSKTSASNQSSRGKAAKRSTGQEKTFAKGDHVAWGTPQGETHGVVERKLTRPTTIKTHKVAASPENPEYLVRSDKSGEQAAHKPSSLRKRKAD